MQNLSIRLPEDVERRLDEEARVSGRSRSEVARDAIADFLDPDRLPRMHWLRNERLRQPALAGTVTRMSEDIRLRHPRLEAAIDLAVRLIGEVADGALPLLFPPEHYDTVYPLVEEGARKSGRSMDEIDFAACVWCSIGYDRQAAEDALKDKIAYYGHALSPMIWDRLGVTQEDFRPIEHALMTERNPDKARALVDERMLRIGIAGSPRDVIERLEGLVARGVKHLSLGPPLGPDPEEAIRMLGREVLPHFS
jgi:alkanesulfonate monooxygenase SsuD/methylene tetrahydromethanopterin reductase-like flavin-dependent oxidoreductase (luciferase family)/Arc/MetJ-type ribon-helix-helix transcriptional regulator